MGPNMRRVCGEYLNSQRISIMTDKEELLKRTPEQLVELILALRSDHEALRGEIRACEVKLVSEQMKCKDLQATMQAGAIQLIKFKKLQEQMVGVEKTNEELSNKVNDLEEANGTMIASIPLQQEEINQLKIRNNKLVKENASKDEALGSLREVYKAATDECAKNKEQIHDAMQGTIDECKERIDELNREEAKKDDLIADFTIKLGHLKNQILGLKQLEAEQKNTIMKARQRHEHDQRGMKTIKDAYTDELNKSKAEVDELRKRLQSTQTNLERAMNVVARPRSPTGKVREGEKVPTDGKSFLTIGNKKSDGGGRKSPLGGGPSLNPAQLARKIKYRF